MAVHPLRDAYRPGLDVSKDDIVREFSDYFIMSFQDLTEFRNTETEAARRVRVGGVYFGVKLSDTTSLDDGVNIIVSADNYRYAAEKETKTQSTPVTVQVPEDFTTIQEAIDAMNEFLFTGDAEGIIDIADGVYPTATAHESSHVQPSKVTLRARTAATHTEQVDLDGLSSAQQIALLRTNYAVEIQATGSNACIDAGFGRGFGNLEGILLTGGVSSPQVVNNDGGYVRLTKCATYQGGTGIDTKAGGTTFCDEVTVVNTTGVGLNAQQSRVVGSDVVIRDTGSIGFFCQQGSLANIVGLDVSNNGLHGLDVRTGSTAFVTQFVSTNAAFSAVNIFQAGNAQINDFTATGNGSYAASIAHQSLLRLNGTKVIDASGTATQRTFLATAASLLYAFQTFPANAILSPSLYTVSNGNSYTST